MYLYLREIDGRNRWGREGKRKVKCCERAYVCVACVCAYIYIYITRFVGKRETERNRETEGEKRGKDRLTD